METWTPERVATLIRLWHDGLSARQIASELGGVSRNAVVGKAHRLKLSRAADENEKEYVSVEEAPMAELSVLNLNDPALEPWMCRWPEDEGRHGLNVCGKTAQPGRHYCAEHLTVSYLQRKRHENRWRHRENA